MNRSLSPIVRLRLMMRSAYTFPIAIFGAGWAVSLSWSWESVVVFATCFILALAFALCSTVIVDVQALREVMKHGLQYAEYEFREVPFAEYVGAYRRLQESTPARFPQARTPGSADFTDMLTGKSLAAQVRLLWACIPLESTASRMTGLATHAVNDRMWITLTNDPKHLTPVQHFQILHELGHCNSPATIVAANATASVFIVQVVALPLIIWIAAWQPDTAAWMAVYLASMFVCCTATEVARRYGWLCDEMLADFYALQHFRIEWFDKHPSRKIASHLTLEEPPPIASWVPRLLLRLVRAEETLGPSRQRDIRMTTLLRSLEQMRQGGRPVSPDPPDSMINTVRLTNLSGYALAIAAFCLGLNAVPPSGTQIIVLVVVMVVVVALGLLILQASRLLADLVDSRLAGRPLNAEVETAMQEWKEGRVKERQRRGEV